MRIFQMTAGRPRARRVPGIDGVPSRTLTGFGATAHREFAVEHRWRLPELAGFIRSTSFLPAAVFGDQEAAFDADLAAALGPFASDGSFSQTVSFAYDLARKPGA